MEKKAYLFIRADESGIETKLSFDLKEFFNFCHYSDLIPNEEHAFIIEKCITDRGSYIFDGNDVHYYIITHPCRRA